MRSIRDCRSTVIGYGKDGRIDMQQLAANLNDTAACVHRAVAELLRHCGRRCGDCGVGA